MDEKFIKAWMEGKVTPAELELKKLEGAIEIKQLEEIIERSSNLQIPEIQTQEMAWEKLLNRINEQPAPEAKIIKWNRWVAMGIAASLSLLALTFFLFFSKTTISTPIAKSLLYNLPDGSRITLNADSKIEFTTFNWENHRSLTLVGEAFFEVKKGSTFTVEGTLGSVTVLGTSFNVYYRDESMKVACFSGKVRTSTGKNQVVLTKGEFTTRENGILTTPKRFIEGQEATWRSGEFYFDTAPLSQVIDEMERQFNVTIVYHGDTLKAYTGYFNTKSLTDALTMVFKPMSLNYHREGNKILVE